MNCAFAVQLRIRYSCGCLSRTVLQMAVGETGVLDEPFETAFAARREALLDEMQRMSEDVGITFEWIERLVDACVSQIRGGTQGEFIAILSDALDLTIKAGGEVTEWQGMILVLYHQLLPCLEDRGSLVRAEDFWQQARVLIGKVATRTKMSQALEKEQQGHMLFEIADRLVTTFNLEQLTDVLFALVKYQDGQLKIVGQHEELLVVCQGGQVERVDTMELGFPIGLVDTIDEWVAATTVMLQPGDGVVLYTDGITEAENLTKELYGLERLCAIVGRHWDRSAEKIKQAVVNDVIRHIGKQKVYDDLTLVVLKQK